MNIKPSAHLYLTFVNDFLSIAYFAGWLDVTTPQAESIPSRSKIMWLSEDKRNRSYFTNNCKNLTSHYDGMRPVNATAFMKRHQDRLLSEYSA